MLKFQNMSLHERESSNNFHALKTGYTLFASGHVQSVQMTKSSQHVFSSMKKDKTYTVEIHTTKIKIVRANCTCPAGISESCVHLSALLHALECLYESSRNALVGGSAVGEPKTSMQCIWLKPRKRKVPATSAHDMTCET